VNEGKLSFSLRSPFVRRGGLQRLNDEKEESCSARPPRRASLPDVRHGGRTLPFTVCERGTPKLPCLEVSAALYQHPQDVPVVVNEFETAPVFN